METPNATDTDMERLRSAALASLIANTRDRAAKCVQVLVLGAGQARVAASYWWAKQGVEHQVLERRDGRGGTWQDRWDRYT